MADLKADPLTCLALVLARTLQQQAARAGDDPVTAKLIATAVLNAIGPLTDSTVDYNVLTLLRGLRRQILRST